jgi:hypothetical protein
MPYREAVERVAGANGAAAQATARSLEIAMRHSSEIGRELVQFAMLRLEDDLATSRRMAACRDPGELVSLQIELLHRLGQQYAEESSKLARLLSEMTMACFEPYQKGMQAAAESTAPVTARQAAE